MQNVVVEYAQPASVGVSHIMGLSGDEYLSIAEAHRRRVATYSIGAIIAGCVFGSPLIRNAGIGALVATWAIAKGDES